MKKTCDKNFSEEEPDLAMPVKWHKYDRSDLSSERSLFYGTSRECTMPSRLDY